MCFHKCLLELFQLEVCVELLDFVFIYQYKEMFPGSSLW